MEEGRIVSSGEFGIIDDGFLYRIQKNNQNIFLVSHVWNHR
jgi:hypothetical protein